MALLSLVVRENPTQSWEQLVATVAELKNVPEREAQEKLRLYREKRLLGYRDETGWKEWKGR